MNLLNKIEVVISFPIGANFHQNIVDYTYKQFLKMLKNLSCISTDTKCKECILKHECQYFKITGENFEYYPGIIFKKNLFEDNLYKNNDEYKYEIYLIGDCLKYESYIEIFFEEYLNHKLAGFYFQLKKIEKSIVSEDLYSCKTILVQSVIETIDFIHSYNNMVKYYNEKYHTNYSYINKVDNIRRIRNVKLERKNLMTRKINIKGYLYTLDVIDNISSHYLELGIGQYNYLGGGRIEIKNKNEY